MNLKPTGTVQINESLHRLSYPGPTSNIYRCGKYFEEALQGRTRKIFYVKHDFFVRFMVFEKKTANIPEVLNFFRR